MESAISPCVRLYSLPRVSPDGTRIALHVFDNSRGSLNLAVFEPATRRIARLTFLKGAIQGYVWSPDSQHIVFRQTSQEQAGPGLHWLRADGAGKPERILEGGQWDPGSFTPDGKRLAYLGPASDPAVWTLPLDLADPEHPKPGKPELLFKADTLIRTAAFSPDGKWLAYSANASGSALEVRPFPGPGGKWQISASGGIPFWLRNGRELFFFGFGLPRVVDYSVKGDSFSAGQPRRWLEKPTAISLANRVTEMAPDGKHVILLSPVNAADQTPATRATFLLNFFDELRRRAPVGK